MPIGTNNWDVETQKNKLENYIYDFLFQNNEKMSFIVAPLLSNQKMTSEGHFQDTRLIEFDIGRVCERMSCEKSKTIYIFANSPHKSWECVSIYNLHQKLVNHYLTHKSNADNEVKLDL